MSSHNVLIVDDAAETRIFLKSVITSLGYSPFEAKSGPEALKILSEHKMDLIILDILMPDMDGYQLLEIINTQRDARNCKVAFMTGIRGDLDKSKLNALKPDEVIHKTVDINVLKTKIKKLVLHDHKNNFTKQKEESTETGSITHADEINFNATITNMPIIMDVKVTQTSPSRLTFISLVQFKSGTPISLSCEDGSRHLNISAEIQSVVKSCVIFGEKFLVEVDILPEEK